MTLRRASTRLRSTLRPAITLVAAMTIITGLAYPLAVAGIGQLAFPRQAQGSLVRHDGRVVGSALIGQSFSDPRYFWGRPSATAPAAYNAAASTGSNLGPNNPALATAVQERIAALRLADPGNTSPVPIDLVTASGSGLDPDISIAAARYQAGRVARARGLSDAVVTKLIEGRRRGRQLGILGEPRLNVTALNLALDAIDARPERAR